MSSEPNPSSSPSMRLRRLAKMLYAKTAGIATARAAAVAVSAAATKASVTVDNINPVVPGVASTGTISFADGALTGSASIALPIETTAAVATAPLAAEGGFSLP